VLTVQLITTTVTTYTLPNHGNPKAPLLLQKTIMKLKQQFCQYQPELKKQISNNSKAAGIIPNIGQNRKNGGKLSKLNNRIIISPEDLVQNPILKLITVDQERKSLPLREE
jgi:hypothetical protein